MSNPVYQLGEVVRTPAHGEGVVVAINRGTIRGRTWREISYAVKTPESAHAVVYYESDLKPGSGANGGQRMVLSTPYVAGSSWPTVT